MVTGPEATVVARVGSSLLRGVTDRASGKPTWPNMHEALMELHEILREWCEAAVKTYEAVEELRENGVDHEGRIIIPQVPQMARNYIPLTQQDIDEVLSPPAPVAQRWSHAKRRQAARRTLRSMMHIYCPELLQDFERAVEARADWVNENRAKIRKAIKDGAWYHEFDPVLSEMISTLDSLKHVRTELHQLIQERYPMMASPE
jgi:hypothetical protein